MKKLFRVLTIFTLGILTIINIYPDVLRRSSMKRQRPPNTNATAEYMKQLTVTRYLPSGQLQDRLQAVSWESSKDQTISVLLKPYIHVYKPDNIIWSLQAQRALTHQDSLANKPHTIDFYKNVIIKKTTENIASVQMFTEELHYLPDKEFISTDKFVKMLKPNLEITGVGLIGQLDKNFVELQQDVKTIYH